jgi:hypothetical protein
MQPTHRVVQQLPITPHLVIGADRHTGAGVYSNAKNVE